MPYKWINESNVLKAAQYLLELDVSCIDEIYQEDRLSWILSLQQGLTQYLNHFTSDKMNEKEATSISDINFLEDQCRLLLNRTRAFLPLLTQYGTEMLKMHLKSNILREEKPN